MRLRVGSQAIVDRMLGGELTHHLGYPPGGATPETATNHRNGTTGAIWARPAQPHRDVGKDANYWRTARNQFAIV